MYARITSSEGSAVTLHTVPSMAEYGCAALMAAEFYLLPVLVGSIRRVPGIGALAVIDIALGWTVIGWVLALAIALRRTGRAEPPVRPARDRAALLPAAGVGGFPGPVRRQPGAAPPLVLPRPARAFHDAEFRGAAADFVSPAGTR